MTLKREIERLREELDQCRSDAGFVIPALREALAAHQAVVRVGAPHRGWAMCNGWMP